MSVEILQWSEEDLSRKKIIYVSDEDWSFLNDMLTETIRIKYYPGSPHLVMNERGDWC